MSRVCSACGRPLKQAARAKIVKGKPVRPWVCMSPVCRKYGKES